MPRANLTDSLGLSRPPNTNATHPSRSQSRRPDPGITSCVRPSARAQGVSPRAECLGIQGTGKNADICCAADCTCACGGDVAENDGKDCFLTQIRAEPPGKCTGAELNAACVLDPGASSIRTKTPAAIPIRLNGSKSAAGSLLIFWG